MKFKYKDETMTYTLKGLDIDEVTVLLALVSQVRLGQGTASDVALNVMNAWEKFEGDFTHLTEGVDVRVSFEDVNPKNIMKEPVLEVRWTGEFDDEDCEEWPFQTGGCGSCGGCDCSGR